MGKHLVVGAGPVGRGVAERLLRSGDEVLVATRSGTQVPGARAVRADAADPRALTELAAGCAAIYNCVNPPYHRWARDWPPVAAALLAAAEASGAVLAVTGNLYGYGEVDGPMTEDLPLAATGRKGRVRARMWEDVLAAHRAGRIRAVEVRGSDYLGGNSLMSALIAPALRQGKVARVPADLDAPHSWTNVHDVARLLVAAAADPTAWGRAWHVPSAPPASVRQLADIAAAQLGTTARLAELPYAALWAAGLVVPFVRELRETQHQFRRPFVLDSSAAEVHFGLTPESLEESVALDLAGDQAIKA